MSLRQQGFLQLPDLKSNQTLTLESDSVSVKPTRAGFVVLLGEPEKKKRKEKVLADL